MKQQRQAFFLSGMCFLLFFIAIMYKQSDTVYMQVDKAVAAVAEKGVYEGDEAPDFTLADKKGNLFSLSDWRGKTIIVNFFASWCHPCQEEMPSLAEMDRRLDKNNYQIIGVNMTNQEKKNEDVLQFLKYYQAEFPVLFDENGSVMNDYKIIGIPTTFIINEKGIIIKRINGMVSIEMLETLLQ